MFIDLTYLHLYNNEFNDEEPNEDDIEKPWVVNMGEFLTLGDTFPNVERKKNHNQPSMSPWKELLLKWVMLCQKSSMK
jgi:hypothetical protein